MKQKKKQYINPFLKNKQPLEARGDFQAPGIQEAISLHQQGRLGEAEVMYRQLLRTEPNNADALHLLGVIAHQVGNHQLAVDLIGQAIEINSRVAIYHSNRGNALKELKQLAAALASYDRAIELKPDYADAYSNRGNALKELKQLEAALVSYDKALEIKPDYTECYFNRGNALKELKLLDAALGSYDKAIALKPNYADAFFNRGSALKELKQLDSALASYDKVIALKPDYADAYSNRGAVLKELKQLDAALGSYDKAIELKPNNAEAYANRGIVLKELKLLDAALGSYDKAIELKPCFAEAYSNRGNALKELNQLEAALVSYDKALEIKPDYAECYFNRGNALFLIKQYDAALSSYDRAIELKPDYPEAYSSRGNALYLLKQYDAALSSYDRAIKLKPDYAKAYSNRGVALKELKQLDAALASCDRAIELKPDYAEAYSNRGNALYVLKQLGAALASYNKAIELKTDYAEAYSNRGNALKDLKQLDAALVSYEKAIKLNPSFAEGYFNKGNVLHELKQFDVALDNYDKAFDLNPDIDYLGGMRQHTKMKMCEWSLFYESLLEFESAIARHKLSIYPFILLTLFDKPEVHLQCAMTYTESKYLNNKALGEISKHSDGGRIRIGYYSADLYYHPVSIWLAEQLENHDKSKVELYAFCLKSVQDPMRDRLEAAFDHWIDVQSMSDLEITKLSRELGIDIAIDLNGHTADGRTGIFAARAAPIQVSHLGFPGSMGAEYIDYMFGQAPSPDEDVQELERNRQFITEKIAYLPCGFTYDRQRQLSDETLTRAQFGLPETGFVFTCQNGCQKLTPEVFDIWMDILKAVPGSVLWLLKPNETAVKNLIKEAKARGVEEERLIFTAREEVAIDQESARIGRYLASYKLADLFLDTWPYNAGTTAVDALWAGLPVLTKTGRAMVARMAAEALRAIEVPELITRTQQEYKELAIELAHNPEKLKQLTEKVQGNRRTTALFDPVASTAHIESAYIKMYERYKANLPPEHIYIGFQTIL